MTRLPLDDPVVYQIYPRSFQDSNDDGIGDLRGITSRLDHLAWLGVDALWMSPIYPSPMADFGYDVADYTDVDPVFGDLAEFDALVEASHARGLGVLLDVVPCHTSIEHRWFREHPDRYVWRDEPNNWLSPFGGSAWSPMNGRYYLHSFYPEQADLDWRNPETVAAMQDVLRFWLDRGIDGYRIDAIDRILKDEQMRDEPPFTEPVGLPLIDEGATLAYVHSGNAPDIGMALAKIREACGDAFLLGELYLPSTHWRPYTSYFDAVFAFELLHSTWNAASLHRGLEACTRIPGAAWVLSNHDLGRVPTRVGRENARAAMMLLLTLPGPALLYQGDEIGQADAPAAGPQPGYDRRGRDRYRHPMQWEASGGFTAGEPWLPLVDPAQCNVADQRDDPDSMLSLVRDLIAARRELGEGFELMAASDGVVAYRRGRHSVVINTSSEPQTVPVKTDVRLATEPDALSDGMLAPHAGVLALD
jgi:alpha-glucosidase